MPPKKRAVTLAQKMAARAQSSVMDSTGTGDPMMDRVLKGETNRKAAMSGMLGTTSKAVTKGESSIIKAIKRMFGGR